ncbi:ADP-ribosylation factor GTPase activating protein, ER-Golgi transport [Boothiomyces macroporosus]|uniref:ADP-ribosylation factor GTPase activating protein, ER-Golgi transport n=1 Tax=Boothiomyces macroporosus TaxID=261099 RepID=A0AAD5UEX2_9FUNG|nr:ADP-ribosylation factor GTPase activating protein, ER-Golgi transport [Boothiomyces macroporosus]
MVSIDSRSVQLDSWTVDQLRVMKVGGNQAAQEYLKGTSFKDAKAKYTSRQMQMYKERLMKLVQEDIKKYPNELVIEGVESSAQLLPEKKEDDFFSDWDVNPAIKKVVAQPAPVQANVQSVSSFGFTPAPAQKIPTPVPIQPAAPVAVPMTTTAPAPFRKKTGAKKVSKVIDFEEAARNAEIEAERVAASKKQMEAAQVKGEPAFGNMNSFSSRLAYQDKTETRDEVQAVNQSFKKFGFGFDPTNAAATPQVEAIGHKSVGATAKPTGFGGFGSGFGSVPSQPEPTDTANRFANAKSISSDQYFNRGSFDPDAKYILPNNSSEAKERLKNMEGRTGFGSDAYYGREQSNQERRPSYDNVLSVVQEGAAEFASKFAGQAQEDYESIKKLVTVGGSKLGDFLSDIQVRRN